MSYERCMAEAEKCRVIAMDETETEARRKGATMGEIDWLAAGLDYELTYDDFLKSKNLAVSACGFEISEDSLNPILFDWQRRIVAWGLKKGRCAFFEGCGLGKTGQQLEWGYQVAKHTQGNVILAAPLAVVEQTARESIKFGRIVTVCQSQADVSSGINVTNYEMLDHFNLAQFAGVILDESSVLKAHDSKTRQFITDAFSKTPYRLACSATPAPNDYMELGTHAEFLGIMTRAEMLAMFFTHDGGETSKWRLKGHAIKRFWRDFMCSWAVMIQKPSDIGYSDDGYILPPIHRHQHTVELGTQISGLLFTPDRLTMIERREVRRTSLSNRVAKCAELVNTSDEQWLVYCDLNDESSALTDAIRGAVEVKGSDTREHKIKAATDFTAGLIRVVVVKGSMWSYGLNLQNCRNVVFVGLSDSFEQIYQGERRCWRFGQTREVHCHVIVSDGDGPVVKNIERKQREFDEMAKGMIEHMATEMQKQISGTVRQVSEYERDVRTGNGWVQHLGDSIDVMAELPPNSLHYVVSSLPFASLYTYSASDRDLGNSGDYEQFSQHFSFFCDQLFRVMMQGRVVSWHCMNLPTSKERDGYIGIRDFRGDVIRAMQKAGFIFHSEVTIWKDPVTAMQRTKAIGLLYKQLRKDSTISRQGIPDYFVSFRKPGENPERVTKLAPPAGATFKHVRNIPANEFPVELWQRYASPVWMDIDHGNTLQKESAREEGDERHICPLSLDVIERGIRLWSNPGDVVGDFFAGIGSTGYQAVKMDRRYIGCELKKSYWLQACGNLAAAETAGKDQYQLFTQESEAI